MSKRDELRATARGNVGEVSEVAATAGGPVAHGPRKDPRHEGVVRAKDAASIPIGKLLPDPDQPRKEFAAEALSRLAASLKSKGQIQPIRVLWDDGLGGYKILVGERRYRAAKEAGLPTLNCIIHDGPLEPRDLRAIQLIENCVREDLNPIDQSEAMRALIETHGYTQEQLADELGFSQPTIARGLALLDLAPEVREKVEDGSISAATGYQVSRLDSPDEQIEVADKAVSEGMSREEVQAEVASRKEKKPGTGKGRGGARGKAQKQTNRIFNTGVRIKFTAESKKGFDVLSLLEASREVTRKLEEEAATLAESVA